MASQEPPVLPPVLRRLTALLVLLVILDLWSTHHLGFGLTGWSAPVAAATGTVLALLAKPFKEELSHLGKQLVVLAERLLSTPVLAGAYLSVFLLISTCSSITVIGAAPGDRDRVTIAPADAPSDTVTKEYGPDLRPARFTAVRTSPFGRPYSINAPGYVPSVVTVRPLAGLIARLGKDISASPAVLFRPHHDALNSLKLGGAFRVYHLSSTGDTVLVAAAVVQKNGADRDVYQLSNHEWVFGPLPDKDPCGPPPVDDPDSTAIATAVVQNWRRRTREPRVLVEEGTASFAFLLGPAQGIPAELQADWMYDLGSEQNEVEKADALRQWRKPVLLRLAAPLAPDERVMAEVWSEECELVAKATERLRGERLMDVFMQKVSP